MPVGLLEALSYAQTRWEAHSGAPSTDGGFGPMNLVDGSLLAQATSGQRADGSGTATASAPASVDRLGQAATLLGVDRSALRTDVATNIRGGAALLAATQRRLGLATGTTSDSAGWYAAVAALSGSSDQDAATEFADDTFAALAAGASRTTGDGQRLDLVPQPSLRAAAARAKVSQLSSYAASLGLRKPKPNPSVECPHGVSCDWVPAPYQLLGDGSDPTNYGNHDLAERGRKVVHRWTTSSSTTPRPTGTPRSTSCKTRPT